MQSIIWAWYDTRGYVDHQGNYGEVKMNFPVLQIDVVVEPVENYGSEYGLHESAMNLSWLWLAPAGVFVARYFRWFILWSPVHVITLGIAVFLTLFSGTSIYNENEGT